MKFVVIGESSGASMDAVMAVYPRHKVVVDEFIERGDVEGLVKSFVIRPWGDGLLP